MARQTAPPRKPNLIAIHLTLVPRRGTDEEDGSEQLPPPSHVPKRNVAAVKQRPG